MLIAAPVGKPVTDSVTLPVLPVRVRVAVMLEVAAPGNTSAAEFESDKEILPGLLLMPLPAEPPQPDKLTISENNPTKASRLSLMSFGIVDEPGRPTL